MTEVEALSRAHSPSTGSVYGVRRVTEELPAPRSTYYARKARQRRPLKPPAKRGPKTGLSDSVLTEEIRGVLSASPFTGEGYRKAWARLRMAGIRTSKARVLRLMRQASLLAPVRGQRTLGPRVHDGTISTKMPDEMWGTDLTSTVTVEDGAVVVFGAVDHCTAECVGIHASKVATRFEALEPIRQGVRSRFGGFSQGVAQGLKLRHDHGSQYVSDHFQEEIRFLGIEASPSFVRAPEGNGCIERFFRTLKEQLLWVRNFRTVEELRLAVHDFVEYYNSRWLVQRHGYLTPVQVREKLLTQEAAVA